MRLLFTSATSGFKIAYLFIFMIIGLFITVAVSKLIFLIPFVNSDSVLASIYVNTIAQSIFAIALPAFLIVAWTNIKPLNYLKLNRVTEPNIKVVFTLLAFIFSYTFPGDNALYTLYPRTFGSLRCGHETRILLFSFLKNIFSHFIDRIKNI